jgi:hypothetical protein
MKYSIETATLPPETKTYSTNPEILSFQRAYNYNQRRSKIVRAHPRKLRKITIAPSALTGKFRVVSCNSSRAPSGTPIRLYVSKRTVRALHAHPDWEVTMKYV